MEKTIHIVACVPAARTFINRILGALRSAHLESSVLVDSYFRKDLMWFDKVLKKFNGRSMIKDPSPQFIIEADACLQGGGGAPQTQNLTLHILFLQRVPGFIYQF